MLLEDYAQQLCTILDQYKDGCVILINGEWGVGKTHFWEDFAKDKIASKKTAYVSLFGKESIESIQSDALIQIFTRNKVCDKVATFFEDIGATVGLGDESLGMRDFGVSGKSLSMILALVKGKKFNGEVICIDDFERKSKSIAIDEIMGFSSSLAERYGCQVVLLMNEKEVLESEDAEVYIKFKEKMVDREIQFNPAQGEIVQGMIGGLTESQKRGLLGAIKEAEVVNLRTIKKAIKNIELFWNSFDTPLENEAAMEVCSHICLLTAVYAEFGQGGLEVISKNILKLKVDSSETESVRIAQSKYALKVSWHSPLDKIVWRFVAASRLDKNDTGAISKMYASRENAKKKQDINDKIAELLDEYTYNVSFEGDAYLLKMSQIIEANIDDIVNIVQWDMLEYIVKSITQMATQNEKCKELEDRVCKQYALKIVASCNDLNALLHSKEHSYLARAIPMFQDVSIAFEAKKSEIESKSYSSNNIMSIVDRLPSAGGWNPETSYVLNSISQEFIKNMIYEEKEFLKATVEFVRWHRSIVEPRPFQEFVSKFIKVIEEIGVSGFGEFRYERLVTILRIR